MNNNLCSLKTGEMIDTLTALFLRKELKDIPSIMLWSAPGVGKSQGCVQVAKNLEEKTGKKVHITDVRLLLFQAIDLRGIPVADANKEFAIWLRPQIFNMNPDENIINMLILDEISAAPPSVQAAAYQLTLDRKVGEHELPKNCIIICAGNRVTDRSVAYKMPKALANRLIHLELEPSIEDWKKWAFLHGIDERIIAYMNYKKNDKILFSFDATDDNLAFGTPRTWEMVSNLIKGIDNLQSIFPLIAGTIGKGNATEFVAYCRLFEELPDIEKIFGGAGEQIPEKPDILYALSGALSHRAIGRNQEQINNMVDYIEKLPGEIAFLTVSDCFIDKELRVKIVKSNGWSRYMIEKWGKILLQD